MTSVPSPSGSIPDRPIGRCKNSKEVGRAKAKDLSAYFLERGQGERLAKRKRDSAQHLINVCAKLATLTRRASRADLSQRERFKPNGSE
jgi:hypothetical protein